jgi:hypothetical protein
MIERLVLAAIFDPAWHAAKPGFRWPAWHNLKGHAVLLTPTEWWIREERGEPVDVSRG